MSCWFSSSNDDSIKILSTHNSMWVTSQIHMSEKLFYIYFPYCWQEVSIIEYFCGRQPHLIFSCDQKQVSDTAQFLTGILVMSFPLINSGWVTCCEKQSHPFLWPTGSELHCIFHERQSHHFPMTNSLWVTLHILSKAVSSLFFPYDQQQVSDITHCVKDGSLVTLIISFAMTNSLWVTWAFCARQLHHFFCYDQQDVSDMVTLQVSQNHILSYDNSLWVTLNIFWKTASSHLFQWPTVCEGHCIFCKSQSLTHITNRKWVALHIL